MTNFNQYIYWLHTSLDYVIAGGLIAAGIYVALYWQHRFARIVGMMLLGAGIGWGCFAYGKTVGGKECYSQWAAANKQARIDAENRDIAMAKLARDLAEKYEKDLAVEAHDLREKVKAYDDWIAKNIKKDRADCRRATRDDIRRLCNITGSTSAACKGAR